MVKHGSEIIDWFDVSIHFSDLHNIIIWLQLSEFPSLFLYYLIV